MSPFGLLWVLPLLFLWVVWSEAITNANDYESSILKSKVVVNIGAAIELNSRVGKEQKTAMEVAVEDVNQQNSYELALNYSYNIHRNPGNFQLLHFKLFSNSTSITKSSTLSSKQILLLNSITIIKNWF